MNSSENNTVKDVEADEVSFTNDFLISTSILTFVFTGIYTIFRLTALKPDSTCNDSINSVIIDVSTCTPLSTMLAAAIGVIMIFFGSAKLLNKKIKILQQEIDDLKKESKTEGKTEAYQEIYQELRAWEKRKQEAEARGEDFDEPLPITDYKNILDPLSLNNSMPLPDGE
ncbi:MAG: hypothetical protein OXI43_08750 [Candidatus Poribacteria bacterium]|nr:hypothetical protein [Candidatus Poribacteria bacterium]